MSKHKLRIKDIVDAFDSSTKGDNVEMATKKQAAEKAAEDMKPIQADVREAARRIKAAGVKPTKGADTATEAEAK